MKSTKNPFLAALLVGASFGVSHAGVLYTFAGPQLVSDNNAFAPPGLSLSRGVAATGTLYFKYTVTNPASNSTTENYYAGMSFYDLGIEHLGVGNGWDPYAYSAFGPGGNIDLKSATPEPGEPYQLVRSTDVTTIVFRVDFNSGANDNVTVWLNPNLSLTEAAQNPALTTTFTANADFDTIYLREGGNNGSGWTFSDIAIAENSTDSGFFAVPLTTSTWDGGGGDSNWSTAANWVGDTAPSAGFDLIFPFSANTSPVNDLAAGTDFTGLNFDGGATSYTLTGNAIGISNIVRNTSLNPQAVNLPLELNGPLTLDALNSTLSIGGAISGPQGITKTGNRVDLTANNTYTGDTAITTGTLSIGDGDVTGSIDPTGTISFGAGTTTRLEINRSDDTTLANPIITGGRANIAPVNGQTVTLPGPITGAGEFWTHGPGTVKITPNAGSAGFTNSLVVATGTLEVADFSTGTLGTGGFFIGEAGSGTLRYTGPTASTDRVGAYALQGVGTNTFIEVTTPSTELTFTQPLDDNDPGGKGLTKTGPGTLILAVAPVYTGNTVVDEGVLSLTQPGFADGSTVTVSDSGQLKLDFVGSDTVTQVVLGPNVFTTPGNYNAASHPTYFSGTGSLVIPSTDPFPTWIANFTFAPGADLTKTGDPDNDGLNNLLEFAHDGDPSSGSASGKVVEKIDSGYLTLTLPVRQGATFTGAGPLTATLAADGLVYSIEGSGDLATFASGVVEVTPALSAGLPAVNSGWSYRTFRLTNPVTSAAAGFLRSEVTITP
jgi:autotransporter-associated beta strand protein